MSKKPSKVFISRNLSSDSIFLKTLSNEGFEVHGESLIEFSPIYFKSLPLADWIFFYSKKGIEYFFEGLQKIEPDWQTVLKKYKLATIGIPSAKFLSHLSQKPDFIGNGNPENTAEQFLKIANGKKVLFPQASNSRKSIEKLLSGKITAMELVVYDNIPIENIDLPEDFDLLVFTSPMNVQAYFTGRKLRDKQRVIAIGNTTALSLEEIGVSEMVISKEPSEESLAQAVLGLDFFL